jgi:hypothetical protein
MCYGAKSHVATSAKSSSEAFGRAQQQSRARLFNMGPEDYKRFELSAEAIANCRSEYDDVAQCETVALRSQAVAAGFARHTSACPPAASEDRVPPAPRARAGTVAAIALPPEYIIGPNDTLSCFHETTRDMSADVWFDRMGNSFHAVERHQAAGRHQFLSCANGYSGRDIEDPARRSLVKEINSRKMFITGAGRKHLT